MPYDLLSDGSRIWTAEKGVRIKGYHLNELQDQLRYTLGEQTHPIPMYPGFGDACRNLEALGSAWLGYDGQLNDPPLWEASSCAGDEHLIIPVYGLRGGWTITALYACVYGYAASSHADTDGGHIALVRRSLGVGLGAWGDNIAIGSTTPWPCVDPGEVALKSATGLTHEVSGLYEYALRFITPENTSSRTVRVHGAYMNVRMSY